MASQWFYQVPGEQVGPISSAKLRKLGPTRQVCAETLVKNAPDGTWVPAERVQGLFAVSNPTPPPMPVPGTVGTRTAHSSPVPKRIVARWIPLFIGLACALLVGVAIVVAARMILTSQSKAPQAARDTLKAIKQLQARTETGVTYTQYVDAVGKAWIEVKPFVESPDGRNYSEFSSLLISIIDQ